MKEVMDDPASGALQRAVAAFDSGKLYRTLSEFQADTAKSRSDLFAAIDFYMQVLRVIPTDEDPWIIATVWNGLRVVHEKLAGWSLWFLCARFSAGLFAQWSFVTGMRPPPRHRAIELQYILA